MKLEWQHRFLDLAKLVARWSKDPTTQVGSVIVDGNRVVSLGYNGYPAGVNDTAETDDRAVKLMKTIHAEENAILFARRDLTGCAIVTTHHPCSNCAAKIIQTGIKEVYCPKPDIAFVIKWRESLEQSVSMFSDAGVKLIYVIDK
jgi:dCMP deaminase